MTIARKRLVSTETTPYYHVIGRCVRRGFLCGFDTASGVDYSHRRQWMVDRIGELAELFAVEVLAYAVMSNHYHLVVRLRPEWVRAWSHDEVLARWEGLYGLPLLLQKLKAGDCDPAEYVVASELLEQRRARLGSLSWFMKCLNEHIARRANAEDHCTGAFWEARFRSQALLDEKALLSCMAYVDLNPIRANMATSPELSNYTSVQGRLQRKLKEPIRLALFRDQVEQPERDEAIPYYLSDYLSLVDWTGRILRHDKRGAISQELPPILERLNMDQRAWIKSIDLFNRPLPAIGAPDKVRAAAKALSRSWFRGVSEMGLFEKS